MSKHRGETRLERLRRFALRLWDDPHFRRQLAVPVGAAGVLLVATSSTVSAAFAFQQPEVIAVVEPAQTLIVANTGNAVFARNKYQIISLESGPSMSVDAIQDYARRQLGDNGKQFGCLVELWNRESRWRWNASNSSSGAYGIPQALPGDKMASAGKDWKTNPKTQVDWGLGYIDRRYGTACKALAHSDEHGWY